MIELSEAHIVVVDDNVDYRGSLVAYLRMCGFGSTREADSVASAVAVIDELAHLDIALLDGNIDPENDGRGSDGAELAAYVLQRFPHALILCISKTSYSWSARPDITGAGGPDPIVQAMLTFLQQRG